jgi:enoyl-CoA hydratase/carnithine racemase
VHFETLHVSVDGPRATLELARPSRLNALSPETLEELEAAARWFDEHGDLKVVVVSGQGRAFSAGADLTLFAAAEGENARHPRDVADAGRRMADALEAMRAVTVARIHGYCIGGGVVLAAACDLRVAADDAVFSIPEIDIGIPLAWGGIPRLVREVGPAMTRELVMTGRRFSPAEAHRLGFLNRVVPAAHLEAETEALVTELTAKAAAPLLATKRHVDAVTAGMVQTARSWADADGLLTAQRDPESRAAAAAYVERLSAR